ncbi:MAG: type II toxin-antitoxin system VapC family toxin [bacterium]|nr:type II toxin-antitoxin system VapC family toxin [bacterium]
MTITAVDTSVIVAALLAWHESHGPALDSLIDAFDGVLVVPAPALAEAYSVMTRLPAPHRLAPADAYELLSGSFEARASVVSLTGKDSWRFLRETAGRGVAGGSTYDALILACARKARAKRVLTLDRRDFERLETGEIEIIVPGG